MTGQRYRTIVCDPPWPMAETGKRTRSANDTAGQWWSTFTGKTTALPYETMTLDAIRELPVSDISEPDAHLYLWTTNRFLEDAYTVARAWGFRPAQLLVWAKPPMGVGFGGAFTTTTEFVIFCRRGKLAHLRRAESSWWGWQRPYENGHIAHSAKPDAFLDLVESVSPGPYLELFAREARLGWDSWGNEALNHIDLDGSAA